MHKSAFSVTIAKTLLLPFYRYLSRLWILTINIHVNITCVAFAPRRHYE